MRVRVLPRDVAAQVITGSIAPIGWAVSATILLLGIPMLLESLGRAGRLAAAPPLLLLLTAMLLCLGLVVWRRRRWTVAVYLAVGFAASVGYEHGVLAALPDALSSQTYLLNRPAVALVLVGLSATTPAMGIAWTALGFVVSGASVLTLTWMGDLPFPIYPGYGPFLAFAACVLAYLSLWLTQLIQRHRVPDLEELETENAVLERWENLARRTTAAVHDTLLNDLSVVMNAPDRVDERTRQQLRDDLSTLQGAEWLSATAQLGASDAQDTALRNHMMTMISGFQWRGLSVHVTGSGDGIYRLDPVAATAVLDALRAALDNVIRHSGVTVAEVELVYGTDTLTVMVADEGSGFDPDAVAGDRLGIRASIVSRIEECGGSVRVWSSPGSGTSVVMTLPVTAVLREHEPSHHRGESR